MDKYNDPDNAGVFEDDQFEDATDQDGIYCECSAVHGEDEEASGKCSCCGLLIDFNDEPV